MYTECPDKEHNVKTLFARLNHDLKDFDGTVKLFDVSSKNHQTVKCRYWFSGDTKQIYQVIGVSSATGTYPCPFCKIVAKEMSTPLARRGKYYI